MRIEYDDGVWTNPKAARKDFTESQKKREIWNRACYMTKEEKEQARTMFVPFLVPTSGKKVLFENDSCTFCLGVQSAYCLDLNKPFNEACENKERCIETRLYSKYGGTNTTYFSPEEFVAFIDAVNAEIMPKLRERVENKGKEE